MQTKRRAPLPGRMEPTELALIYIATALDVAGIAAFILLWTPRHAGQDRLWPGALLVGLGVLIYGIAMLRAYLRRGSQEHPRWRLAMACTAIQIIGALGIIGGSFMTEFLHW